MPVITELAVPKLTPSGEVVSAAQGAIGQKIILSAYVLYQASRPVDTLIGRTYSHFHVLKDQHGNLYHYKGSSFFPKGSKIAIVATVKAYCRGEIPRSVITVIKAPKAA